MKKIQSRCWKKVLDGNVLDFNTSLFNDFGLMIEVKSH